MSFLQLNAVRRTRTSPALALAVAAAACALFSGAAAAKPLYITVNRAYASSESPVVDVAFQDRGPVELRVLKPTDVEKYMAAQANLRRVWDEPATHANPGRALSKGVNQLRGPGDYLLFALSLDMRKELAPAVGEQMKDATTSKLRMAEGQKKLVGIPAGMELVRSQWLNLDLGGQERGFDVPGFDEWSGNGSSGYQERRVTLRPLPAGIYVLQLVQGTVEGQVVLVVTDMTVAVKQTDGTVLVRAAGRDQRPVKGAAVVVREQGGARVTGTTDENGEAMLHAKDPRLLVTVSRSGDTALVDTEFFSTLMTLPDVFLYTDRPIYHPGDEVRFRGVVRKPESLLARLFLPAKRTVQVDVRSDDGKGDKVTVAVDDFGSFSGKVTAPKDATAGVLRVTASVDGREYQGEARVQDYVKPTFYVEMTPDSEAIVPGTSLHAKIHAERYAGGAPKAGYEVMLTRTSLDAPAWVDDAGKGGSGSAVTYGSASTTEGQLSVPDRVYSSVAARLDAGEASPSDTWASAPEFDEKGDAEITVAVPALKEGEERVPWKYTLSVRARDDQETFASVATSLFLSPYEAMASLHVAPKVVKVGAPAVLDIHSTSLSGKAYPKASGDVHVVLRSKSGDEHDVGGVLAFTTDDDANAHVTIPTSSPGSYVLRVTVKDKKGAAWSGEDRLIVVGNAGEAVEWVPELTLLASTTTLGAGEGTDVVALLPDEWGPGGKNEGPLWLTLSGDGIYGTRMIAAKGNTVSVPVKAERRFGSAVYASLSYPTRSGRWEERVVPFRIVRKDRVLDVKVEAAKKEAEPNGEQTLRVHVTDARGRGVKAEVSVGVVDKAVYAVQAEFRPGILDFFYPVTRNNVATFFSSEFQGYGYGHVLARRMAGFGDVRFAAIKPPKKNEEKDTAYFNASIVTDDDGNATVSFKLPSNQTLWTVTGVAADTSGRVGEGTSQFATRGKLSVATAAPQFLRSGDEATAQVRLSRPPSSSWKGGALDVTASGTGCVTAGGAGHLALGAGAQASGVVPLSLKAGAMTTAAEAARSTLAVVVKGGPDTLSDGKLVPVVDNAIVEDVRAARIGGGALKLDVPAGSKIVDVELVLEPGLVDAMLGDARDLLVYPYGCLEQLVSTTTPVLALVTILDKNGVVSALDADSQSLLAEARSRASYGVGRILDHAQKGGGFVWFPGDTPTVEMTLIALNGLLPALDAGLVSSGDPRVTASLKWLEAQGDLGPTMNAVRANVLAGYEGNKQAARVRALVDTLDASSSQYVVAVAVNAAARAGVLQEPAVQGALKPLVDAMTASFLAGDASRATVDDAWRYPLHATGAAATIGRAAFLAGGDRQKIATRMRALFAEPYLSTFDRGTLIFAALPLVELEQARMEVMKPPSVDKTIALAPRGFGLAGALPDGTTAVVVGAFDGVATLRAHATMPAKAAPAVNEGFSLDRKYWLISGDEKTEIDVAHGATVAQGSIVYVELDLRLAGNREWWRSAYGVLVDSVPAGFTPLEEDKEYRGGALSLPIVHESVKRRAFTARSVTFFLEEPTWWMEEPRTVGYVMRADFAGTFSAPGATLEDMYWAKAHARTAAATLTVTPSAR